MVCFCFYCLVFYLRTVLKWCNSPLNMFKHDRCPISFLSLETSLPESSELIQFGPTTLSLSRATVSWISPQHSAEYSFSCSLSLDPLIPEFHVLFFLCLLLFWGGIYLSLLAEKKWLGSEFLENFHFWKDHSSTLKFARLGW